MIKILERLSMALLIGLAFGSLKATAEIPVRIQGGQAPFSPLDPKKRNEMIPAQDPRVQDPSPKRLEGELRLDPEGMSVMDSTKRTNIDAARNEPQKRLEPTTIQKPFQEPAPAYSP